jgi:3-methyladenine DNA glycosylase/8-oxoguanine DNA glycosylase
MKVSLPSLDLDLVVRSHGWYDLPPFEWDEKKHKLEFVFLEGEDPVRVAVEKRNGGLVATASRASMATAARISSTPRTLPASSSKVESRRGTARTAPPAGALHSPLEAGLSSNPPSLAAMRRVLSRVLDLKADLSSFHSLCAADPRFAWIARRGAGRILRAPTLFEDAVKVLATTNCTWGLTKVMVNNLIGAFGRDGAFPDAAFVAGLPEARLKAEIKMGYRAPYLASFAEKVASGALDLARWEEPARRDEDLEEEIRSLKGFGPYAADTLGRLLGRHAKLGIDSWTRKKVAVLRFRGRKVKDARVAKLYAGFGRFAGLAFWLDMTRDWHSDLESVWP